MARQAMTKKIMVLGVDGMDARITKHLMDEGKMPNVKKFVDRGSCREDLHLLGAIPTITPPCWTTLATGAYPRCSRLQHGQPQLRSRTDVERYHRSWHEDPRMALAWQLLATKHRQRTPLCCRWYAARFC